MKSLAKKKVIEILDFLKFQVQEDKCSVDEIESIAEVLSKELDARGTVSDFARFYGKPESNVRTVLSRRYIPESEKPKRRVTYRFGWFSKMVPNSWREE